MGCRKPCQVKLELDVPTHFAKSRRAQMIHGPTQGAKRKRGITNELPSLALRASVMHGPPKCSGHE